MLMTHIHTYTHAKPTPHHTAPADGERPRQWVREAHAAVQEFYSPQRLLQLCNLILERLLGMRPADLEVRGYGDGGLLLNCG